MEHIDGAVFQSELHRYSILRSQSVLYGVSRTLCGCARRISH